MRNLSFRISVLLLINLMFSFIWMTSVDVSFHKDYWCSVIDFLKRGFGVVFFIYIILIVAQLLVNDKTRKNLVYLLFIIACCFIEFFNPFMIAAFIGELMACNRVSGLLDHLQLMYLPPILFKFVLLLGLYVKYRKSILFYLF